MKSKIKLIAVDLDGTLLQSNGEVSLYGMEILEKIKQQGIQIMVCSGRPVYSIERIFKDHKIYDYIGANNGQTIINCRKQQTIEMPLLEEEHIQELLRIQKKYPVILSYSQGTSFYHAVTPNHYILGNLYQFVFKAYHEILHRPYWQPKLQSTKHINITQCEKFCYASKHNILKRMQSKLSKERYTSFFVGPNWLEVQRNGISKGNALTTIMSQENIKQEEVIAIGDGDNDIPMLEVAGIGVAMGNASNHVKEKADQITLTCKDDGAIVWLENNLLNI